MIAAFLVSVGVILMVYLIWNRTPNHKAYNIFGAALLGIAVCIFIYNYTYLGTKLRGDQPNPTQVPPTSQECAA